MYRSDIPLDHLSSVSNRIILPVKNSDAFVRCCFFIARIFNIASRTSHLAFRTSHLAFRTPRYPYLPRMRRCYGMAVLFHRTYATHRGRTNKSMEVSNDTRAKSDLQAGRTYAQVEQMYTHSQFQAEWLSLLQVKGNADLFPVLGRGPMQSLFDRHGCKIRKRGHSSNAYPHLRFVLLTTKKLFGFVWSNLTYISSQPIPSEKGF